MAVNFDFFSDEQSMAVTLRKVIPDPDDPEETVSRRKTVAIRPQPTDATLQAYGARVVSELGAIGVPTARATKVAEAFAAIHSNNREGQ